MQDGLEHFYQVAHGLPLQYTYMTKTLYEPLNTIKRRILKCFPGCQNIIIIIVVVIGQPVLVQ